MAENSNFVQPDIPKFDGYYDHWAMLMENSLRSKEYWNQIEHGVVIAPQNATAEQTRLANESKIRDLKLEIFGNLCAKNIKARAQLQALQKEFEVLAMKENESVDEYFARTLTIANKMTAHEESNDVTTLTIDELQSSLLIHEQRMKSTQEKEDEQALK
ncbi:retrovirus-related pol polyprotein from transposon TNT 1-94, partial [Trifolium medium]|nr:retrovirus-related pol polyprotein from transposon TNT 1-94 [Trifolium medium]